MLRRFIKIFFVLFVAATCNTKLQAEPLALIGSTTFRYFGFKVYEAKVFAPAGTKDIPGALGKVPVKLALTYARDLTAQDFIESGEAYMKDNKEIPFNSIKTFSDQMNHLYKDVKEGDIYTIYFMPGEGIQLFLNDVPQGQIKNDRFATAYLTIWKEDVFDRLKLTSE